MSTIQPAVFFRSFPRAPRAQYFAARVFIQAHTVTIFEETTEQNKLGALFQPIIDISTSDIGFQTSYG